jgi:hypothetical protein
MSSLLLRTTARGFTSENGTLRTPVSPIARLETMCGERKQCGTDRGEFMGNALDKVYRERGIARSRRLRTLLSPTGLQSG